MHCLDDPDSSEESDRVYSYTRVLCHYGALMEEFRDGWREGDGERVVRCWKLFMLHFKASGATKYALEALRLQFQLKTLSAQSGSSSQMAQVREHSRWTGT